MGELHPSVIEVLQESGDFFHGYRESPGSRVVSLLRYAAKAGRHVNYCDTEKTIRALVKIACLATAWADELKEDRRNSHSATVARVILYSQGLAGNSDDDTRCLASLSYLIAQVAGAIDTGIDSYLCERLIALAAGTGMWATYLHSRNAGFGVEDQDGEYTVPPMLTFTVGPGGAGTVQGNGGKGSSTSGLGTVASGGGTATGYSTGGTGSSSAGGDTVTAGNTADACDAGHPWCESPYVVDTNYTTSKPLRGQMHDLHHEIAVRCQEAWESGRINACWSLWDIQKLLSRELDAPRPDGVDIHLDWWMNIQAYTEVWAALKEAAVWSPSLAAYDKQGKLPVPAGEARQPHEIREEFERRNDEVLERSSAAFRAACQIIYCHCGADMPAGRKGNCQICGCPPETSSVLCDVCGGARYPRAACPSCGDPAFDPDTSAAAFERAQQGFYKALGERQEKTLAGFGEIREAITRGLQWKTPAPFATGSAAEDLASLLHDVMEVLGGTPGSDWYERRKAAVETQYALLQRQLPKVSGRPSRAQIEDLIVTALGHAARDASEEGALTDRNIAVSEKLADDLMDVIDRYAILPPRLEGNSGSDRTDLQEAIGVALGRASTAWSGSPQGEFDSATCSRLIDELMARIDQYTAGQPARDTSEVADLLLRAGRLVNRALGTERLHPVWGEDAEVWKTDATSWLNRFRHGEDFGAQPLDYRAMWGGAVGGLNNADRLITEATTLFGLVSTQPKGWRENADLWAEDAGRWHARWASAGEEVS